MFITSKTIHVLWLNLKQKQIFILHHSKFCIFLTLRGFIQSFFIISLSFTRIRFFTITLEPISFANSRSSYFFPLAFMSLSWTYLWPVVICGWCQRCLHRNSLNENIEKHAISDPLLHIKGETSTERSHSVKIYVNLPENCAVCPTHTLTYFVLRERKTVLTFGC